MAVVTRPSKRFPCLRDADCYHRASQYGWSLKSTCDFIKTQLCTAAITLTVLNSVRLPREATRHGVVPYLVLYSGWLVAAGLPVALLQLAMGQLSQQDPVGVWRAVPILRGVGHLKVLTAFISCVYNMVYVALAAAYLVWIGKGSFPLKDCIRLQLTPHGYENKMNASECFNSTFLAPFTLYPQYLGVMAIIVFILWFFVPVSLYRLRKSLKVTLSIIAPVVIIVAIILVVFLGDASQLYALAGSCAQWAPLAEPYIWHSAMVQALLSSHIGTGYLISAGGTIYRHADVRWAALSVIFTNLVVGWLWVFLWYSIDGHVKRDSSFIGILVLIYQSAVNERRPKQWPLLAFAIIFLSGIITVLTLLFPIYEKFHRMAGDNWRLVATGSSAVGTALTVAVLSRGVDVAATLDELVVPVLAVFTSAVEVVGFVFIYGWCYLTVDIEFLTGNRLPCCWTATWWTTPLLLLGVTGWWLRALIKSTWDQTTTLWPLVGVLVGIVIVMVVVAAVAVAKEEQFNLATKIAAAFRSSRLWGPEEPMGRYIWMSQRHASELTKLDNDIEPSHIYPQILTNKPTEKIYSENWLINNDSNYNKNNIYSRNRTSNNDKNSVFANHSIPRSATMKDDEKFRSPNICIAEDKLGGPMDCNCNRHFTLNVPNLRNNEVTTSL